jgi:hypothetical protein
MTNKVYLPIKLAAHCGAILFLATAAFATTNNYSIGISFGSDQRSEDLTRANPIVVNDPTTGLSAVLAPTDLAGVPGVKQRNWNNFAPQNSPGPQPLVADTNDVSVSITTTVEWVSNGTWATSGYRGLTENNGTNFFPGTPDNALMTGYLDTGNATTTRITLTNLPPELTAGGYHVYVYSMGGAVGAARGGSIRVVDAVTGAALTPYKLITSPTTRPTSYVEDAGVNHTDNGVYVRFLNLAAPSIAIEATTTVNPNTGTPRAPVNAVQLVAANLIQPVVTSVFGDAQHFYATLLDLGGAVADTNAVTAVLDNQSTNVPVKVTKQGANTLISYDLLADKGTFFGSGSTHQVRLTYSDTLARSYTNSASFVVPAYVSIPSDYALSAATTSQPGFKARTYQMPVPRGPGNRGLAANAERALALGYIDPDTGQPYLNSADTSAAVNGFFEILGVINFNETAGGNVGSFPNDLQMPGIPGTSSTPGDYYVVEFRTFLQLKAGVYRFGVNSDEGFKLLAGRGAGDVVGVILGIQDGTRGASDTIFDVVVPADGYYPFRLVYNENTGANSEVEFYVVDLVSGQKTLVNDLAAAAPINAYRESAVTRPYVSKSLPARNYGFAFATDDLVVEVTDGAVPVNAGSVSLTLNGAAVTNITKNANVTTIKRTGSLSNLLPSGVNNLALIYAFTEGGNTVTVTNSWSYTVVPYTTIPAAYKVAPGSATGSGFNMRVAQIDRSGDANQGNGTRINGGGDANRMPWPEVQLANGNINPTNGLPYPNLTATTGANPDGSFDISAVLNFNLAVSGTPPVAAPANSGIFNVDVGIPGLPGTGTSNAGVDNYVAECVTYLDLKAGAYVFGGNSDDGFVVNSALNPHDTLGTLLGFFNAGRGNSGTLPAPNAAAANLVPTPGTGNGNTAFGVIVPEDGIYPFRLLWWQGGGGVNLEFLTVDQRNGIEVLVNDVSLVYPAVNVPLGSSAAAVQAYNGYSGQARPWVKFSVSPTPWDNRVQQAGPGPIKMYGRTQNAVNASDINNDSDSRRSWADVRIGGVIANGVGDPTLGLVLDGARVGATYATNGSDVTVSYKPSPLLTPGSHTAALIYGGTTNSWSFITQTYTNVPASNAVPATMADPNAVGFKVKMTQLATAPANQNTVGRAEAQLAGTLGADVSTPGPGPNGTYIVTNFVNWNNNRNFGHSGNELGNFQANNYGAGTGWPYPFYADQPFPGTGITNSYTDNLAAEIFAYLNFPNAGYYKFGVSPDDGFKMQVGTPGQTNGTILFTIDRGAGPQDIPFSFTVPQAGLYPMRLVYYNGGGGAALEFFSYDDNGNKIPVNDPNNPASIKAYYNLTSGSGLQFTSVSLTGGILTIDWSGTGRLQQAANLTGQTGDWSDVSNPPKPYTTAVGTTGQKFYRLVSP